MIGATPPPKISPAPTTIPIADEISPGGADSVEIGPLIRGRLPRQQKLTRNNKGKRSGGSARLFLRRYRNTAAQKNPTTPITRRPNRSDRPGTPNCPTNPPNPSPDITNPICVGLSFK